MPRCLICREPFFARSWSARAESCDGGLELMHSDDAQFVAGLRARWQNDRQWWPEDLALLEPLMMTYGELEDVQAVIRTLRPAAEPRWSLTPHRVGKGNWIIRTEWRPSLETEDV